MASAALVFTAAPAGAETDPAATPFHGLGFGEEQRVGIPVQVPSIIDMAFGELDGRTVGYTATSSDGSLLNVIDIASNTFVQGAEMPSVIQVWKLEIAPNGKVYVAAIGKDAGGGQRGELWIYDPEANSAVFAGAVPGSSSNWSMVIDDQSNAYIGTYKTGEVVKYDAAADTFTRWDRVEGEEYVRSIEYHDGYVYAGTGATGAVVKIDAGAPSHRERISDPLLDIFGVDALPWAYDMQKVGDWLVVNFSGDLAATAFYNLETQQWSTKTLNKSAIAGTPTRNGNPGFTQLAPRDGKIYLTYNGTIAEVDLSGEEPVFSDAGIPFGLGMRGQAWVDLGEAGHPGEWLVTASRQGPLRALDLVNGKSISLPNAVQTSAGTPLHTAGVNADGDVYMVTYPAGTGAVYDTTTGAFANFPAEQAESMLTVGDTTYFGLYPGGHIDRVVTGESGRPQSSRLFTIGDGQDRPYHMVEADGKLFIGSIPGYGLHQGALTIHDLATGETTVEKGIVENQSVIGLAVRDGIVYGSTTIVGGLGAEPIATEAKMFTYDVARGEKTGEYSLDLPSGQSPKHISALSFGPDGNLWGTTDGWVFALDPETMQVIESKSKNILPDVTRYGMWRPMSFDWYDGKLLINVASRLTVVDPETMEHRIVTDPDEELARFVIAPLAPKHRDDPGVEQEGIYLFGTSAPDTLRVIPLRTPPVQGDPVLSLSAPAVRAGETVDVALSGFAPDAAISLWLGDRRLEDVTIDAKGGMTLALSIPAATTAGVYDLAAKDESGAVVASAALTVEDAGIPVVPVLALSADTVRAGDRLDVRLSGFAADQTVQLWMHSTPVRLGDVVIGDDGTGSATLVIPASSAAGDHAVVATDADGVELARADVAVTAGDGDAGDQGQLPQTGSDGALWLSVALAALATIALGVWMRRRKLS
ncbi:LPXTG cell wall anchor domain-containing protein [Microbacterium sp. NPDC058345]|uniref:LPXTG cell wall anchor domain-containing protein n=1 Tax=Microbacterium sp. NPDC058345 TaxID=3346455 RepID=UPI0036520882